MVIRKAIPGLVLVGLLAALLGWWSYEAPKRPEGAPMSVGIPYKSIKELAEEATLVVEVKVSTDPRTISYSRVLFAVNQVQVIRTLKGSPDRREITILDTGGEYKGKEYGLGGMPLMHAGDRYLLFLIPYKGPVVDTEAYQILGVWQGKIRINDRGDLQYIGPVGENRELQAEIKRRKLEAIPALVSGN